MFVREVLESKGFDIWSISPESTVYTALKVMAENNVGALIVIDDKGLAGIFSERDYARKVVLEGKTAHNALVRETMNANVIAIGPDQTIEDCMKLMTENHVRHLPVMRH